MPSMWKIENFIVAKQSVVAECQRNENHPMLCYNDEVLDALYTYWHDLQDPEKRKSLAIQPIGIQIRIPQNDEKFPSFKQPFCHFITPCLYCLIVQYENSPFAVANYSDVTFKFNSLYDNIELLP
ncbi:hypothetical protein GEMRC1_001723 [Eukaryota sp. GEM-RC1]